MQGLFRAALGLAFMAMGIAGGATAQQTPLSPRPLAPLPEANPSAPPSPQPPAPPQRSRRRAAPPTAEPAALARDLDAAMEIDAAARAIAAQRNAVRSREALVRSPIPGAPAIGGSFRSDTRGPREARETELELAAPLWLPGQRGALAGTVATGIAEQEHRLALRRLELAALLRDAYWTVRAAEAELRVARQRLATAREIARDFERRAALGDISGTEALLGRNEVLAAELDLVRAETGLRRAEAAYRTLTGGSTQALSAPAPSIPAGPMPAPESDGTVHPAVRAAEAALATAEARARLVAATPRDNPELGVFMRHQGGPLTEEGVSLGLRLRLPLSTEARNAPRRADAEAERTRAQAELLQTRREVEGEVRQARLGLAAAQDSRRLAAERRAVADRQSEAARRAFRSGEIGGFDLFRVRQLQIEAAAVDALAEIEVGRALSRLHQALGSTPHG
ncbi:MAG: TolC family protein [Acetobacteraceae bacterium]|nr:TolC family protein [Acetobacteraceae bacterium]